MFPSRYDAHVSQVTVDAVAASNDLLPVHIVYTCKSFLICRDLHHGHVDTLAQAVLRWRELAEACHLDSLLAHCELSMIRDRDEHLWRHPDMTCGKISHNCLLRMFRASQLLSQKQSVDIATLMAWRKEMP